MEPSGISAEEFSRLQNQLIELRTQNYEIAGKFKKTTDENKLLREKAESKEKDLQKINKLMKFPGFQALSKNRNRKSYDEIVEENERLMHQMQRHEEDFNLQNKTLLEEVSRLSVEKDTVDSELGKLRDARSRQHDENDDLRRIKAENTVLLKKLQELEVTWKGTENEAEINSTDRIDSGSNKRKETLDSAMKDLRETVEIALNELLENRKIENSENGSSSVEDEGQQNFVEKLLVKIGNMLEKAPGLADISITEEVDVQLETEQTENRLLRDQLEGEREQTQKDIAALKSEVDKLTEKTKRKRESYLQLQDEKESLHKEKRRIEEEWIATKENLAKTEEQSSELEQKFAIFRQENENLRQESIGLRERVDHCSAEKVAELENITRGKNEELMSLKSQIEETTSSNQELISEVQKLSTEKDELEEISKINHDLAEKRKNLLDKLSVERQHELTSYNAELDEARNEIEEQGKKLEVCMSDLEKCKREITLTNDRHSELLKKYAAVEKKSGWLERTLKDMESQMNEERGDHLHALAAKEQELQEKLDAVSAECQMEIQAVNDSKASIALERDEQLAVIEKMNQAAKDKDIEFRIISKKGDQLLKDLKRQLKMERKRADQIQLRLQDFLTDSKSRQTFDEIFKTDTSIYKGHRRQDSGSHLSTVSSNSCLDLTADNDNTKSSTPLNGTPLSGASDSFRLPNETIELISKVSDLQLEKNVLEEKVRHLEESSSVMVEDVMRKTGIIQSYIRDTKADLHPESVRKRNMTLKEKMKDSLHIGKQGKSEDMLKEMNTKMQRLLEETLEKNMQLEKDVDHLTRELEKAVKPS